MISGNRILIAIGLISAIAGAVFFQVLIKPEFIQSQTDSNSIVQSNPESFEHLPLISLNGDESRLGDWKNSILIINFWAPWCAPCRREIPALIELQKKYAPDVQIIGMAADNAENVERFQNEYQMNYPSFLTQTYMPAYNSIFTNPGGALPFTVILDSNRNIVFKHHGEAKLEQLEKELAHLKR
ncbi:MAG: thiol-disulfide isomerase/thioredoxin [Gammaproteobacteria bacterium]|jgi:thiol-disulfide isomerase/thioredoxin